MRERVSPESDSVTADGKQCLRCLCAEVKTAEQIAHEMAADPLVSKAHRSKTVADRLAYLARHDGTLHGNP